MNSRPILTKDQLVIALQPDEILIKLCRRHWLFWWHKKHVRSVLATPALKTDGDRTYFYPQYFDTRTGIEFMSKEAAQGFLGKTIIEPWYTNEACEEKQKNSRLYVVCTSCGHIGHEEKMVTFSGPAYLINNPITTTVHLPCRKCKTIVPVEVCTTASVELPQSADCDWLPRPVSPDIKRVK